MKKIFKIIIVTILQYEAKFILKKYKPKVIAITGSIGKTTTKDAVFAVLSKFYYVRKSEKSHNSEIGLLLSVLGCPNGWNDPVIWVENIVKGLKLIFLKMSYPEVLVLEVGASKTGDIEKTSKWLKTDIVIMTAIGLVPAHIEFFGSYEKVLEEKAKLASSLKKNGLLFWNSDNQDILKYINRKDVKRITFGISENADFRASNKNIFYQDIEQGQSVPVGVSYKINYYGNSIPVIMEGVFGDNNVYGSLVSIAIAKELGLDILQATEALRSYDAPPGRMRILQGINKSFIIDDTYNSSPKALESAIQTLGEISSAKRKIAILGDMLELGKHTNDAHISIGNIIPNNIDILITIGLRARDFGQGAIISGMNKDDVIHFNNKIDAQEYIKSNIKEGDMVLIKGSQSMRMEKVVELIMMYPEYKHQVLVRQEKEWLDRE